MSTTVLAGAGFLIVIMTAVFAPGVGDTTPLIVIVCAAE
jgi:hypothetical protein